MRKVKVLISIAPDGFYTAYCEDHPAIFGGGDTPAEAIEELRETIRLDKELGDKAAVVKGEEVKLSGFGIFSKKARAAREGTNPSNQKKIKIPASNTVAFKVSKAFKEKLN